MKGIFDFGNVFMMFLMLLYYTAVNLQTPTEPKVTFGQIQISNCEYKCSYERCNMTLLVKYYGNKPLSGINATLYNANTTLIGSKNIKKTIHPGEFIKITFDNIPAKYFNNLNFAPFGVDFSGDHMNFPPLKITDCKKLTTE